MRPKTAFKFGAMLLLSAVGLAGCVSIEKAAPPASLLVPGMSGSALALLEEGRTIYITKCARCHVPEPVMNYTREDWDEILEDMIPKTKLSPQASTAVRAYVNAAVKSRPGA